MGKYGPWYEFSRTICPGNGPLCLFSLFSKRVAIIWRCFSNGYFKIMGTKSYWKHDISGVWVCYNYQNGNCVPLLRTAVWWMIEILIPGISAECTHIIILFVHFIGHFLTTYWARAAPTIVYAKNVFLIIFFLNYSWNCVWYVMKRYITNFPGISKSFNW